MKKYLFKQTKKAFSLFLAVVMLMSCWVWVAPEKAEAAEITPLTQYTVKINVTFDNPCDGGHVTNNGTTVIKSFPSSFKAKGDQTLTYTTTSFPTSIMIRFTTNSWATSKGTITSISVNDHTVISGGWGLDKTCVFSGANSDYAFERTSDTSANQSGTVDWPLPKTAGFVDSTAKGTAQSMSINKIGGAEVNKATSFTYGTFYDQYGVKYSSGKVSDLTKSVWISKTATGKDLGDSNIYYDATKGVVAKPELQLTQVCDANGKFECYLVESYTGKNIEGGDVNSKVSAKYTITFPKYDVVFDAVLDGAEIKDASGTLGTKTYTASNYYGKDISVPTAATKDGYTFYGFWSKPQPTAGNASYNASAADFAKPCTSDEYASYKDAEGSTVTGDIVTDKDGNKWYDAGEKLDPAVAKSLTIPEGKTAIPEKWYGWWLSKDLSIKFYDVDGAFLGEQLVKAGQKYSAITWPTSKYVIKNLDGSYKSGTYTSGAFKYDVDPNIWVDVDGTQINKTNTTDVFSKDIMILTPLITKAGYTGSYTVKFVNPADGNSVSTGNKNGNVYDYRADIEDYADNAKNAIPFDASTIDVMKNDIKYRYELLGWSNVEPTTGKNYHVVLEDADFDVNGTAINVNNDWIVRGAKTYYAIYRRHTKTYAVRFSFKDATGTAVTKDLKVKYGAKLVPPTELVPYSYVTDGYGYTFENWIYNNGSKTLGYNQEISFTNENGFGIAHEALDDGVDVKPIVITAKYGEGVPTPYTVTFNSYDDEGVEIATYAEVKNGEYITEEVENALTSAEYWEYENQRYSFANKWEITEGSAVDSNDNKYGVDDIIDTENLSTLSPKSNLTLKAVYTDPVPYFTVTYIDGSKTFTERVLQGSVMPEWTTKVMNDNGTPDNAEDDYEEDKSYVPANYEGDNGTYEFQGWYDAKQTDEDFKQTNGNKFNFKDENGELVKVTGNLTLYSQFKFVPFKYTVTFMNHDGSVQLGAGIFEKGQSIESVVSEATKAAQTREADETYTYLFIGWDKAVPTFCEGYDVTYTALYKPVYKYYDVKWYNSNLVDGKWVADETALLATTKHTYESKLNTPSVGSLIPSVAAPAGQTYVFAGWYYNDAEGNAIKYEKGMKVTSEMEFYATYTLTEKTYTVTTNVKGETTRYTVGDGKAAEIADPQAGYVAPVYVEAEEGKGNYDLVDGKYVEVEAGEGKYSLEKESCHDAFIAWYTDAEFTNKYVVIYDDEGNLTAGAITADTTLYAKFEESAHELNNEEFVTAPTYYKEGEMKKWCSCNEKETSVIVPIDVLTDNEKPTGTIYLGTEGQWSSDDEIGGAALDVYDEETGEPIITLYANEDTDVIITANDTGDVHDLYNTSGKGIGVKLIRAFVYPANVPFTKETYEAAQQVLLTVYEDTTEEQTNNANFAFRLGDALVADLDKDNKAQYDAYGKLKTKPLQSGEAYIIYYNVVDKAGNQLNSKVRTPKFIYDNTAPVFKVEGENNGANIPTYCATATVTGIEKGAVLEVNGTAVEVTYAEGASTGTYVINYGKYRDNVLITATDNTGNTYTKKIKIADHIYLETEKAASCGVAGYKVKECTICGYKPVDETYPALDHIWSDRKVTPADCVNNGLVTVTCTICGEEVVTEFEEDRKTPVIPALGHEYAKDAKGEIIYTTVTASTCHTAGLGEAYCTACGEGKITKDLALDPNNHEEVKVEEQAATCENDGYYKKICDVCNTTVENKTYPATGHGTEEAGTAAWFVKTEPSCKDGEKVLKCLNPGCDKELDSEVIPANGKHSYVITKIQKPDVNVEGIITWTCEICGDSYDEKRADAIVTYTVTFNDCNGNPIKTFNNQVAGSMISKTAVTAPEKPKTDEETFTFDHWLDDQGNKVKLPLTVTKDMTLTAQYKPAKRIYTHQFRVPNTWASTLDATADSEMYTVLVGAYGDEDVVPTSKPVFKHADAEEDAKLKKLYTFEFKGWKDIHGNVVTDFTVTTDKTFYAYFIATAITYDVTFYNGVDLICMKNIGSGASVDVSDIEAPAKNFNDAYHYTFAGWKYQDGTIYNGQAITGKTQLYAYFTAEEHTYEGEGEVIQTATCTLPSITKFTCSDDSCDHTKEVTGDTAKHTPGDAVEEERVDGIYSVVYCSVCDTEMKDFTTKISFSVVFKNSNGVTLQISDVRAGDKIKYEKDIPTLADYEGETYTFKGWRLDETDVVIENGNFGVATKDIVYTAVYTVSKKTFSITFVDKDNKSIKTIEDLEYKYVIKADDFPANLEDYKTKTDHYTFVGWSANAGDILKADLIVKPVFDVEAHTWKKSDKYAEPDCEQGGGIVWECECGATETRDSVALGHKWVEKEGSRVEPDLAIGKDGYYYNVCTVCGKTSDKITIPAAQKRKIEITVKDEDGNVISGAVVQLFQNGVLIDGADTNAKGTVTFKAYAGNYKVLVSGKTGYANVDDFEIIVGDEICEVSVVMKKIVEEKCGCSCHRNGFWGIVFRFFHKIIAFFTGGVKCCADPDSRY